MNILIAKVVEKYPHFMQLLVVRNLSVKLNKNSKSLALRYYSRFLIEWYSFTDRIRPHLFVTGLGLITLLSVSMFVSFLMPKSIEYNFSSANCFFNPVILPNHVSNQDRDKFIIDKKPNISVVGYPITSFNSCVSLKQIPEEKETEKVELKSVIGLSKSLSIELDDMPILNEPDKPLDQVSANDDLEFNLDKVDATFQYSIVIAEESANCYLNEKILTCPLKYFNLKQGESYEYKIFRNLGDTKSEVLAGKFTVLNPLTITGSSIQNEQIIYDKLSTIDLTFSKEIKSAGTIILANKSDGAIYKTTTVIEKDKLTINLDEQLPRGHSYLLTLEDITATNGAYLEGKYELNLSTSTGPKVLSTNIGTYKVSTNPSISLTFDIDIDKNQNISDKLMLSTANGNIPISINVSGRYINLRPISALPACTSFKITLSDDLVSIYGISGGSAWTYSSRTICQQVFSIGNSVQGRTILAYRFGSGSKKIVFVGGLHGNEKSSTATLNAWIDELERNYSSIPADKTVVVIPNTNPDGYVTNSRTNANGVDLNRNFPANDWSMGVYMPQNQYLENGGGSSPLSEPESSAVASYISSTSPYLVLTYHAVARTVIHNGSGNSAGLGNTYGTLSGFSSYHSSHEDGIFAYPTTGELETWLHDKLSIPTLLVELASLGRNEISTQKQAMWAMVGN